MKFSFTQREKIMLIGLLVVIIALGFFRLIYLPVTLENQTAQMVYNSVTAEEEALMSNVLSKSALKDKIHELQRLSRLLTKQLPPEIEQEYVIKDLLNIVTTNDVELLSFSFEGEDDPKVGGAESVDDALAIYEASMEEKSDRINDLKTMFSEDKPSEDDEEDNSLPIQNMTLNITCRGVYGNLRGILRDFNELDNTVVVKEVTFVKERDSMIGVMANVTLEFPYYPDNSDYELEAWDGLLLQGDGVDPFNYFIRGSQLDPNIPKTNYQSFTGSSTTTTTSQIKPTRVVSSSDFYVNARPKFSDDFAYTIGKKGDNANRLSSDLDGEELTLEIVENNGNPAFKIGTKLRPITETTKAVTFAPQKSGLIKVEILSQPRVGDNDTTKAVLTIKNTTSTPVQVTIKDEDANNPRVKIMKEGDVTIK